MREILKVSKFRKPYDFYFWSVMIVFTVSIGAIFLASFFPYVEITVAQRILEALIRLDGVLFGFTAVMAGLFLRDFRKLSEATLKRCLLLTMSSFWSYTLSIFFAFTILTLGQENVTIPLFTPIYLTLFGNLCSSIYLVMIFIEEIFPREQEIKKA